MTEQADQAVQVKQADGKTAVTPENKRALAADLRAQAAAIEASLPPEEGYVRLRTELPHESFTLGGTYVGNEWTDVPKTLAPGVLRAAVDAGVTVTQQEG